MNKCRADAKALLSKAKVAVKEAKSMDKNLRSQSAPAALSALERYKRNAKKSQPIVKRGMVDMQKMIKKGKEDNDGITALATGFGKKGGRSKRRRSKKRRGSRKRSKKRRGSKRRRSRKRRGSRSKRRRR